MSGTQLSVTDGQMDEQSRNITPYRSVKEWDFISLLPQYIPYHIVDYAFCGNSHSKRPHNCDFWSPVFSCKKLVYIFFIDCPRLLHNTVFDVISALCAQKVTRMFFF